MPYIDLQATGLNIKTLLKAANITVKEMAEFLGFTSAYPVYKWINGQNMPTLDNLVVLADKLGVGIDAIVIVKRTT